MKKKLLRKIALWTSATVFVLFTVLVVHIYQATHKPKKDARERQLSRIDFQQPLNQEEAEKIRTFVAGLDGVQDTHMNVEGGILVYTYASGQQTSANVFAQLMKSGNYKAKPYVVSQATAQNGCPAMGNEKSLRAKFVSFIAKL